ncbi:glycosyltransferase family 2 protein [Herminiimonas contaminans]|jgi:glycosyltransferase involved in cell wall biosynthesis|uniref:Glycosyltransferase family 2 protein n=1 Tax=Herminiimonas contaminans TaxID=1111140 RepID=A0ABS0EWD4_9BURK|nr:glycosyltransferase family 2 protein [Herminiimonas contaminans]MBF8179157.1 glycosyltransferase family 2 protein [Herminiimonas contaminans]
MENLFQIFDIDEVKAASYKLSVIVPLFNEESVLPIFHDRLKIALSGLQSEWEVIYVDDGSTDRSHLILQQLRAESLKVGVARFSRNFGKEEAMSAGLRLATGDAAVIIDSDLQDPPELIPEMIEAWLGGADIVNMRRRHRSGESWLKKVTAHAFYRVINRLSDVPVPADVGDFRLLSRRAINALNLLEERNRFMKGLFAWIGYKHVTLDYNRDARAAGKTKWRYWRLWNFALEGITGFSVAPLKIATYLGSACAGMAFFYAMYFLLKTLLVGESVKGFPTLIVTVMILGGLQLMAIGIIGEYLGRLFIESKRRPLYLLEDYQPPSPSKEEENPKDVCQLHPDIII